MNETEYKPVSLLSVVALVTGVIGLLAFVASPLVVSAFVSIVVSAPAFQRIRRYNLSGARLSCASALISGVTLILAPTWHLYQFNSESLPSHVRVDFSAVTGLGGLTLDDYANKAICLKGYALFESGNMPTSTLYLSPDGDDTKISRIITVKLPFEWKQRCDSLAVSGTLTVNPHAANATERYILDAKAICPSNTSFQLAPRVKRRC